MSTILLFKHEPHISAYGPKLAQLEIGKTLKTIKVDHNNFLFLMYLKGVQSLALDFKFYNTQNFNIFVKLITYIKS